MHARIVNARMIKDKLKTYIDEKLLAKLQKNNPQMIDNETLKHGKILCLLPHGKTQNKQSNCCCIN